MKYLSSSTTTLSIAIAVALFALASWFDAGRPPPQPPPPEKTPNLLLDVRPDSAVRDRDSAQSCRDAETRLMETFEASQTCSVDADCSILDYGYPLQCMSSIARDRIPVFREEYRRYEASCEYRVYYDCETGPMVRVPVCRESRCSVELNRNDVLRQLTLDHIGQ